MGHKIDGKPYYALKIVLRFYLQSYVLYFLEIVHKVNQAQLKYQCGRTYFKIKYTYTSNFMHSTCKTFFRLLNNTLDFIGNVLENFQEYQKRMFVGFFPFVFKLYQIYQNYLS